MNAMTVKPAVISKPATLNRANGGGEGGDDADRPSIEGRHAGGGTNLLESRLGVGQLAIVFARQWRLSR